MQQYSTVLVLSAAHLLVYLQLLTTEAKKINLRSAARRIYTDVARLINGGTAGVWPPTFFSWGLGGP